MSKAKKFAKSIPEIYQGIDRDPRVQHHCVCEDVHGQFFRHNKPEEINVVKSAQHKVWKNFDAFCEENEQTVLAYHENMFKSNPPKDQDKVSTALYVWFALCGVATDRTGKTPKTGAGRVSGILMTKYYLSDGDPNVIKTPQAMVCYRIARETIEARAKLDTDKMPDDVRKAYVPCVTEEELRKAIENRAAEIRTRQDPWRIFQYYRPQLIANGLLRRV